MLQARNEAGPKLIEAAELRMLIDGTMVPGGEDGPALVKPSPAVRAMILLDINCGCGQSDIAALPLSALDLEVGWLNFPRVKTALPRRIPLWGETVKALRAVIADRPDPRDADDAGLVFLTKLGKPWVRLKAKRDGEGHEIAGVVSDAVRLEFGKLLTALGFKRRGMGFYWLRHTFRTIADSSKDQPAVDHLMGHSRTDMGSLYRDRIDDDRLEAVTKVVYDWSRSIE